jgi:hypothetical protein
MTENSVFISSCTRRDLSRRQAHRGLVRADVLVVLTMLAAVAVALALTVGF